MPSLEIIMVMGYIRENIRECELYHGIIPHDIKILCSKYYDYLPVFLN